MNSPEAKPSNPPPISQEQLIAERLAAIGVCHQVLDIEDQRLTRNMPAGSLWGCPQNLVPRSFSGDVLAQIRADIGFFDALFVFSIPAEERVFAYELMKKERSGHFMLKNHRDQGMDARYDFNGELLGVIEESGSISSGQVLEVHYKGGQLAGALQKKRTSSNTTLTFYGPQLQIERHFPTYDAYRKYIELYPPTGAFVGLSDGY